MDALDIPDGQVPNPLNVIDADWNNAISTAMSNFWSDRAQTVDGVIAALSTSTGPFRLSVLEHLSCRPRSCAL